MKLSILRTCVVVPMLGIALFGQPVMAIAAETESRLNEDQTAGCNYASQTMQWLAKFRDRGDSETQAVDNFMNVARTRPSDNVEMEKATRADASRRASFVYVISEFTPITFGHFEFSVCKMRMLKGWRPDLSKAEQITAQVVACQTKDKGLNAEALAVCIDKVVLDHHE